MAAACTLFSSPEQCVISSVGLPEQEVTTWLEAGSKPSPLVTGRV